MPSDDRRHKLLDSTMDLATALRWATSHRTSAKHAAEYTKSIRAYLASPSPDVDLLTNHHIDGWWIEGDWATTLRRQTAEQEIVQS